MTNPPYRQASREQSTHESKSNVILDTPIEIAEALNDPNSEYKKTVDALATLDRDALRITIDALIQCILESNAKVKDEKQQLLQDLLKIAEKKEQEAKEQAEAYIEQQQQIEKQNIAKMQTESAESFTKLMEELTTKISTLTSQIAALEALVKDPVALKKEQEKISEQWTTQQNNFADLFVADMHAMDKKIENLDGTSVDESILRNALKMPSPVDIIKQRPDLASSLCDDNKPEAKQIETQAKQMNFLMQLNQQFTVVKETAQIDNDSHIDKASKADKILKANRKNGKSLAEVLAELDKKVAAQNTKLIQDALKTNSTYIGEKIISVRKVIHQAKTQLSECEEKKQTLDNRSQSRP